jgi:hypothetical protein
MIGNLPDTRRYLNTTCCDASADGEDSPMIIPVSGDSEPQQANL